MKKFKIGVFAFGKSAVNTLQKLAADDTITIAFVMLRIGNDDKDIKSICAINKIECLENLKVNNDVVKGQLASYNCDLFVSMNFDQIFKTDMINIPPLKTINCHTGKLPYYRGKNTLNWSLINGESDYGVTVHYVDEGIDTGDIILQGIYPITDADNSYTLLEATYDRYAELLYTAIKQIQAGNAKKIKQTDIHPVGFYCGERRAGDEIINWNQPSRAIFNFIRGVYSPGHLNAISYLKNEEIKIFKAKMVDHAPVYIGIPGQVVGKNANSFFVKTADTVIEIVDYLSDRNVKIGDRLKMQTSD